MPDLPRYWTPPRSWMWRPQALGAPATPSRWALYLPDIAVALHADSPGRTGPIGMPRPRPRHPSAAALIEQHGRPVKEVALTIQRHLAGLTVYSDSWAHDSSWLGRLFDRPTWCPPSGWKTCASCWASQADHCNRSRPTSPANATRQRHRASADARLLQLTVLRLRALATDRSA